MPAGAFDALGVARRVGRRGLRLLLVLQLARTSLRLGFSAMAAVTVGKLVMEQAIAPWVALAAIVLLVLASLAGLLADRAQAASEAAVSVAVRDAAADRLAAMSARQLQSLLVGTAVVAMQRHPEAVASLVIGHRAATVMMAAGPLVAAAALVVISWQAAVLVIGLTPVMIVFFALVGGEMRRRADQQERSFGRLAGQFADRIRTLPTILANHALAVEEDKLAGRLEAYTSKTMGVLSIAFVNAGIIDFFASLSIAMLAVFLGLGHLKLMIVPGFSNLELWQSLFILMIAPDYFTPFRRFSEQYHAKAEGVAAAAALDRLLEAKAEGPALALPDCKLPRRGLVAITGPSGSGKSTLLRRIAGIEPGEKHAAGLPDRVDITWVSTDSYVPVGDLGQAIAWNVDGVGADFIAKAADSVGLLDDVLLPDGLRTRLDSGAANLSGGQRLRIAVARAMVADRTVFADEPTAKLDRHTASAVCRALVGMARTHLVVVATHDSELVSAADLTVDLAAARSGEAA
jgi:ATP-binding cassette subfamily C protein